MFFVDADNAMGSPSGDVDDAFAIAALVRAGAPIAAISSVAGNTTEPLAFRNNERLSHLLGYSGPLLRGPQCIPFLSTFHGRVLALGPLTNVAAARPPAEEIVLVGGNSVSRGRWPPWWPHEFNLTKDRAAARTVFASAAPLTIFPLNVARQLWVQASDLDSIDGTLGEFVRSESARWFRHLMRVRLTRRFPIYDLAPALYALDPAGFAMERTTARMTANTWIEFDVPHPAGACPERSERGHPLPEGEGYRVDSPLPLAGEGAAKRRVRDRIGVREVKVCRALNRQELWGRFLSLLR